MEPRRLIHEGYLKKSPPEHKIEKNYKWLKRYFRLWSDKTLEYYRDVKEVEPIKEPIDLRRCDRVCYDDDKYRKYGKKKWIWFFRLKTPERVYHFIASSKPDMDNWMVIINELCADNSNFDIVEEVMNGLVPGGRSNSTSSRSAWSTASSTNSARSSPGMGSLHSPTTSMLSAQESHRQRLMSTPSDSRNSSPHVRSNTTPTAHRPFDFIENDQGYDVLAPVASRQIGEGAYDIPPDPVRATSFDTPDESAYNFLPEPRPAITVQLPTSYYDMKEPITVNLGSPMNTRRQNLTTSRTENPGYVHMEPKPKDEYTPIKPQSEKSEQSGPSPEKVFRSLPFMQKSKTLPKRQRHDVILDEIPDLKDKKSMKDITDDAPKVLRDIKPAPKIDRAKKPSAATLPPRLRVDDSSLAGEHSFSILTDSEDGMSAVHTYYNDIDSINALNNYSSPTRNHYSNHHLPRKHSNDTSVYLNQPSAVNNKDSQTLKVGDTVKLTITPPVPLHYNTHAEQQHSTAYENSSPGRNSAKSSVSASSLYENDETFADSTDTGYMNFSPEPKTRSLTYSEVEGSHVQHGNDDAYEETNTVSVPLPPVDSENHYVFVDPTKSNAVKLTLQQGRDDSSITSSITEL